MEGNAACDPLPDETSLQEYMSSMSSLHTTGIDEVEVRLMQAMNTHTQLMAELEMQREEAEQRSTEELERLLREQTVRDRIHAESDAFLRKIKMELQRVESLEKDNSNVLKEVSNIKVEGNRLLKRRYTILRKIKASMINIAKLKNSIEKIETESSDQRIRIEKENEAAREVQKMLDKIKDLMNATDKNQGIIKARIAEATEVIEQSEKAILENKKILNEHQDELGKIKNIRTFLDAARETAKGSKGLVLQRSQSRVEKLKAELAEAQSESEIKLRSIMMLEAELQEEEDTNNQLKQLLQDLKHLWESGNKQVSNITCQADF